MVDNTEEILKDIIQNFSVKKVSKFFRLKTSKYAQIDKPIEKYNDVDFKDFQHLGELRCQDDDEKLIVASSKLSSLLGERSSKKKQYEKAKLILSELESYGGIFIFYDQTGNFRFSFIYKKSTGTKRIYSNFRRFTYYVSKSLTNKTFLQRVGGCDFASIEAIQEFFSVDKVSTQFFDKFREYFEKTKFEFEKSNKALCLKLKDTFSDAYKEQINKFAFTFLGRLIFIYFLQRKGLIESKENFIRNHIEDINNESLYISFFQPLFFDVFAKKNEDRPADIKKLYSDTPYLNGGLFEKSQIESDNILILDDLFIKDLILNFFEAYNFTVDENSPDDQEVSIDPEMLGKVFENTLVEEERGYKGTFYTPREVVHFMVKESLVHYLNNETNFEITKLKRLIYSDDLTDFSKEQIRILDKLLENIKVLDPAVGSAAFPVEIMNVIVHLRKLLSVNVGKNVPEVELKKRIIKNNLFGVDIDSGAIEIAKLRLWLSLIVDYERSEVQPLPNLDFQFRLGNSLLEKVAGFEVITDDCLEYKKNGSEKSEQIYMFRNHMNNPSVSKTREKIKEMQGIIEQYFEETNEKTKKKLKDRFDSLEDEIFNERINELQQEAEYILSNPANKKNFDKIKECEKRRAEIDKLKQAEKYGTHKLFIPKLHFSKVFKEKNGFDIVIGNPPYGVKVDDDIKDAHELGSKDSYGVFISTSLKRFLKDQGVLSLIVSDTWLTIKTHFELRKQVLEKRLHKIIRLHQDCFDATVNSCVLLLTNTNSNSENPILVEDLCNISTRSDISTLRSLMYFLEDASKEINDKYAVYHYKQNMISLYSNCSIFVASPKLYSLMANLGSMFEKAFEGKKIKARKIKFNSHNIELVRLGDIADIKQGLATGDNDHYLFQNPDARGTYKNINDFKKFLLTEKDLEEIRKDQNLRSKVVEIGLHKSKNEKNFDSELYFDGRYIVPYDKGGESDTGSGWLPNYYVPTNYFIDWSTSTIKRLKTLTIKERDNGKGKNVLCAVIRNSEYYFKTGISYSRTGIYSPTFRFNSKTLFDTEGSLIFPSINISLDFLTGLLSSKFIRYLLKNYIGHTVHTQVDELKELPVPVIENPKIISLVGSIVAKQKQNLRYDYMANEQKKIDKLVYEMYGLNADDSNEVETWFARRYPKLAKYAYVNSLATSPV